MAHLLHVGFQASWLLLIQDCPRLDQSEQFRPSGSKKVDIPSKSKSFKNLSPGNVLRLYWIVTAGMGLF